MPYANHTLPFFSPLYCLSGCATESKWKKIATGFEYTWNFPHCIGALDGKHICMKPPPGSGSLFYNYKNTISIVFLALVDADYKFIFVDVGCYGRVSDGGVFRECALKSALESNKLNVPRATPIPQRATSTTFHSCRCSLSFQTLSWETLHRKTP